MWGARSPTCCLRPPCRLKCFDLPLGVAYYIFPSVLFAHEGRRAPRATGSLRAHRHMFKLTMWGEEPHKPPEATMLIEAWPGEGAPHPPPRAPHPCPTRCFLANPRGARSLAYDRKPSCSLQLFINPLSGDAPRTRFTLGLFHVGRGAPRAIRSLRARWTF